MEEQDILQHLLEVEKSAAELVLAAQEEADKRVSESASRLRAAFQTRFEEAGRELEARSRAELERAKTEAAAELERYRRELASAPLDTATFNAHCEQLFFGER